MDHDQRVAYYDADVAVGAYVAGPWQGQRLYSNHTQQQQPALPSGYLAAAYGACGGQQPFQTRSEYTHRSTAQAPSAPSYRPRIPADALCAPAQYAAPSISTAPDRSTSAAGTNQGPMDDSLKSIRDLPSVFQPLYSFRFFNAVQSECFEIAYKTDTNMVVSAPTGAGKTGVMELAILHLLSKHLVPGSRADGQQQMLSPMQGSHKVVYIGPIKALVQERHTDWQSRYGSNLGLRCVQLTGDVDDEQLDVELEAADIICTTPEKFDQVTRKVKEMGKMAFFAQLGLVLLDEVHLLNEAGRGSSLEAGCVGRIKAVAAVPEMAKAHVASVRFVAVSATIPNIHDLATWLNVPPAGIKQYGDELRPCKLTTHVKGYNPAKNDFLFERRLNEYVYGIVTGYSNGRPALVFCNSRKGTMDTAAILAKEAATQASSSTCSVFVKTIPQVQRLQAAATQAKAKGLASALMAGVGFHNAAMEPEDRDLVESLFKSNDLPVLCTTSTLAMGVNLPAHLVVIKGTTRYVGDSETAPGETTGYKEYSQTEVLQMVGRAGRPQFDNEGVAVIMTSKDSIHRYQRMVAGQAVESCLMANLAEHLNAELVLGTIQDVPGAIQWIKSSFLYTRVRSNPQHYGLANKLKPGMNQAEVDSVLKSQLIMQPVSQLLEYQLATTDEDTYSLSATKAGKLMANHFLKLRTMAAIVKLRERPNMPSLLRVICGAEEFKNTSLRRCEKKVLNDMNHATDPQQLRYHVMATREDGTATGKVKERLSSPQEKLFVLLNDALADKPCETLDYSLKQEQERLLLVGQRIAKCMARYFIDRNSFSSAGRSLLLARSLRAKLWDDSQASVRQVHGVGKLLAARLSSAGLGCLKAVMACNDAHQIEVAAQKPYPWGSELLANLRAMIPPAVTMQLQVLEILSNRAVNCQLTLTRIEGTAGSTATVTAGGHASVGSNQTSISKWAVPMHHATSTAAQGPSPQDAARVNCVYQTHTPCKLLCGCSNTDQLLLMRSVVLETFASPLQLSFRVEPPADSTQPIHVSARLVLDRFVGLDEKASITIAPSAALAQQQQHGHLAAQDAAADNASADPVAETDTVGSASSAAEKLPHGRSTAIRAAAEVMQVKQRSKRRLKDASGSAQGEQEDQQAVVAAAAAKQPCRPSRQRETAYSTQALNDGQPYQQQDHAWSPAALTNRFAVAGINVFEPRELSQRDQVQAAAASRAAAGPDPAAVAAGTVPRTAIAARYNRLLQPAAASTRTLGVQQQPAGAVAVATAGAAQAPAAAEALHAAISAGRLQVTPEHQRHLQQLDSQQSTRAPQQHSKLQMLQAAHCQEPAEAVDDGDDLQQATPAAMADTRASSQLPIQQAPQEPTQQPDVDSRRPVPDFDGSFSIAAMFDMLADDMGSSLEQQQQPKMIACQEFLPKQFTAAAASGGQPHSGARAAEEEGTVQVPLSQISASAAADQLISTRSGSCGTFAAAVMQSHAGRRGPSAESLRSLAAAGTSGLESTSFSSQLNYQHTGLMSQSVGLGAQRLGSAGSSASRGSCATATRTVARGPSAAQATSSTASLAEFIRAPQYQQHMHQPELQQQQDQMQLNNLASAQIGQHRTASAEATAACLAGYTDASRAAAHGQQHAADDLMTPPRQIVRSGPSSSLPPSQPSVARNSCSRPDVMQLKRGVNVQVLGVHDGTECNEGHGARQDWGSLSLQQFAYEPGARPAPMPASYRPSQNALMFHRPQTGATPPVVSNRVLAQAKLAGRPSSHASCSSSSRLTVQRLQQQVEYRGASMVPHAAGSFMGGMGLEQSLSSQQQQQHHANPADYLQPPAVPRVQWGGFVDKTEHKERVEVAKQARATWRQTANGPAAQHLANSYLGGMPKGALGLISVGGGSMNYAPGLHAVPSPQVQAVRTADIQADVIQAINAGSGADSSTAHACVVNKAGARALDDDDGGCVDFSGIFAFMKC